MERFKIDFPTDTPQPVIDKIMTQANRLAHADDDTLCLMIQNLLIKSGFKLDNLPEIYFYER